MSTLGVNQSALDLIIVLIYSSALLWHNTLLRSSLLVFVWPKIISVMFSTAKEVKSSNILVL